MATSDDRAKARAGKIAGSGAAGVRLAQARNASAGASSSLSRVWSAMRRSDAAGTAEKADADGAVGGSRQFLSADAPPPNCDASAYGKTTSGSPKDDRAECVQKLVEQVAAICGIAPASVRVDGSTKMGCRLTRSGIDLMVNCKLNEDIAARRRFGVRGSITVEEVDAMTACFVATRAQDYLMDDWHPSMPRTADLSDRAQRFLQSFIDDLAAFARMTTRIPFARTHLEAYLSRAASHAMTNDPLHLQYLRTLRLYLFENDPKLNVSPFITAELGTTRAMNPLVDEVRAVLFDCEASYCERHERIAALVAKPFARFLHADERAMGFYDMFHLYDNDPSYGSSQEALEDESALAQEEDNASRVAAALKTVTSENIDQLIEDNAANSTEELAGINLGLPSIMKEAGSIAFDEDAIEAQAYEAAVAQWRGTIDEVADILAQIATPQEQLSVPRYDPRLAHAGMRMHPAALVNAAIQLQSGQERAIWQRPKRMTRPQNMHFQGLDIFLLLDTSISMTGENARNAAAMAACLAEGLELAQQRIGSDPKRDAMDVRTQLIAFGEGWAPLTPLEASHDLDRKRLMFSQLSNPQCEQTLIAEALLHVLDHARAHLSRDVICLVVSDGLFADGLQARKRAMEMPDNVYLAHINIGEFTGLPLTENFETIRDAATLPDKLHAVLERRLRADQE